MTYYEQALRFLEEGKTVDAVKYFGYARNYGSKEEKARAEKILELLKSKKSEALRLVHSLLSDEPVSLLLKEKRYALALEKLLALGDDASAEEFYFLGVLHDDFGMGMPNDREKARLYFGKSWGLGFAAAAPKYVRLERSSDALLTSEQRELLLSAGRLGCIEAEMMLLQDDVAELERRGVSKEERAAAEKRLADFLREKAPDLGEGGEHSISELEVRLARARRELALSSSPIFRYEAYLELWYLRFESWHTGIASRAAAAAAQCSCNGIFLRRDLEESEWCFKEALKYGKMDAPERAREYLSRAWKQIRVPEEGFEAWIEAKCSEVFLKVRDALFFVNAAWRHEIYGASIPSSFLNKVFYIKRGGDYLENIQLLVDDFAEIFKLFLEISDAKKIVWTSVGKTWDNLKSVLAEMEACCGLKEHERNSWIRRWPLCGDVVTEKMLINSMKDMGKAWKIESRFLDAQDAFLGNLKRVADELRTNPPSIE